MPDVKIIFIDKTEKITHNAMAEEDSGSLLLYDVILLPTGNEVQGPQRARFPMAEIYSWENIGKMKKSTEEESYQPRTRMRPGQPQ